MFGHEGQNTTLALDSQPVCVRDDLNAVNVPACKPIDGVEHLERSNQIKLIHWRHRDDDDPPAAVMRTRSGVLAYSSHGLGYYAAALKHFATMNNVNGIFRYIYVANCPSCFARILSASRHEEIALAGGKMVNRLARIVGVGILVGTLFPTLLISQTTQSTPTPGPYAVIGVMRAIDERHSVDLDAGYVRHLEWHRQVRDAFGWYSYSIAASTERQRWIIYATFGHTAAELSNPVSPAEDWRDASINLLPHVQFTGSGIYEFLPALSRGNGVPTATPLAEYTTVELNYGAGKAFEAALAGEQSKLQGETLWYRLVAGGNAPRYVRLRPRASLASILDEHTDQALPEKVNGLVSKMTVETWTLRPNMLVNVTPEPAHQ
jgi:hypothetical protein